MHAPSRRPAPRRRRAPARARRRRSRSRARGRRELALERGRVDDRAVRAPLEAGSRRAWPRRRRAAPCRRPRSGRACGGRPTCPTTRSGCRRPARRSAPRRRRPRASVTVSPDSRGEPLQQRLGERRELAAGERDPAEPRHLRPEPHEVADRVRSRKPRASSVDTSREAVLRWRPSRSAISVTLSASAGVRNCWSTCSARSAVCSVMSPYAHAARSGIILHARAVCHKQASAEGHAAADPRGRPPRLLGFHRGGDGVRPVGRARDRQPGLGDGRCSTG